MLLLILIIFLVMKAKLLVIYNIKQCYMITQYESKHRVRCDDRNFTNWAAPCSKKLQRSIFTSMKYPIRILKMDF